MEQTEPSNNSVLPYFPNLDGLRFFGFLVVFCSHGIIGTTGLFTEFNYRAAVGLDMFFVMSAFLITFRLIKEKEQSGAISLRRFFWRRSLRVWPLYFAMVFFGYGLHALMKHWGQNLEELPPIWTFLTFTMNFWIVQNGESFLFFMIILWSVCLEEQFYLLIGFFMRFLEPLLLPFSILLILGSLWFRYTHQNESLQMMYNSISLAGSFGMGVLAAWTYHRYQHAWKDTLGNRKTFWIFVYILFLINFLLYPVLYENKSWGFVDRPILWVFMAVMIVGQCLPGKTFLPMGASAAFRYLGKISYGLYVFHGAVISAFLMLPLAFESFGLYHLVLRPILILGVTILIASISYKYFERPFLRLKAKLSGV
jgi:peptidoglycan/LPS O-acetylase OafA/YrhL